LYYILFYYIILNYIILYYIYIHLYLYIILWSIYVNMNITSNIFGRMHSQAFCRCNKTPKHQNVKKKNTEWKGENTLNNFSPFLFVVNAKIPGNIKVYALEPNRRNFLRTQAVAF